jgi:hypothetical protein
VTILPLLVLFAFHTSGCWTGGAAGSLRTVSLGDHSVVLPTDFKSVYYSHDPVTGVTSIMLSDIDPKVMIAGDVKNGQFMHVELLWIPMAGRTPLDSSATNATIRYILLANGEMGIYGGAGFANPSSDPGTATMSVALKDASINLLESTPGFRDLLSPAQMTGVFNARRDEQMTRQMNYAASQIVTNILGRTRFVLNNADASAQTQSGQPTGRPPNAET